ncbi:MAG: 2TM domain-containing protein [Candidatus Neomarinimicrobiota bacterium]
MTEQSNYEKARKRVEEIKGFYIHLLVYVCVNAGLFGINALSSPSYWWAFWPLLGWGIGLLVHGLTVFGLQGFLGPEWEERKIREIMEKDKRQPHEPPAK